MSFQADFVGNTDIILGVQWLRTLGVCTVDWIKNEWSFNYKGRQVKLTEDPALHATNVSPKMFSTEVTVQKRGCEMELKHVDKKSETEEVIPQLMVNKLLSYESVFQKPTGLPPVRGSEHAIKLKDNTEPVSVRPYRYPHAHKEVMERLVQEMLSKTKSKSVFKPSVAR